MNPPVSSPVGRPRPGTSRAVSLLLACVLAGAARAQQAPSTARPAASDEDDTVVLSPFEVNADADQGYLASTAQSGTRLRTDLKDIASSVSVVTKDFMNDIGATDLGGLLIYTLGTEVNGVSGNFSDAGTVANPNGSEADYDGAFESAAPSTRVRGLTSADLARDFFITNIPLDSYNTDRVEISRGPNAMLFGLGSPAGIINNSLINAKLDHRRTTLEARTDQYGSLRTTLDHNQVLLKNKLALRVASVYEEKGYRIEEAWRRNKRLFLTGTYRPFRDTLLRASFEVGATDSNAPETRPPYDAYSFWWDAGRPVWDPNTNTGYLLGTPAAGYPNPFNANGTAAVTGKPPGNTGNLFASQIGAMGGGNYNMVIVYNDPNSRTPSLGLPGSDVVGFRNGRYPGHNLSATGAQQQTETRGMRDSAYILNHLIHWDDITSGFWKSQQITDPRIFDFYHHMLHGPNKHEWARFHTYNVTLEQQLFDHKGGVELAFNRDDLDNGNAIGLDSIISGYAIRIDMQDKLANGQANPNFGRPFTVAYSKASVRHYDRDTLRGTAYYNLDLSKTGPSWLGHILGHHRLTATYSDYDNTTFLSNGNFAFVPGTDFSLAQWGKVDNNGSGHRGMPIIRYLGPDVSQSPTPALGAVSVPTLQWPSDLDTAKILFYHAPPSRTQETGTWSEETFHIDTNGEHDVDTTRRYVTYTREKVDSAVGIAQSYWFDGKLVSTLGWRRDDVRTYNAGTPAIDPDTGVAIIDDPDFYPKPVLEQVETSFNYGLVGHTPDFIQKHLPFGSEFSVYYNEADNFRPAGQRYNIWDEPIPAETGHTQEYGVMLSTFHGKLVLRAGHYKTTSGLSSSLVSGLSTPKGQLLVMMRSIRRENLEGTNDANPAGIAAWDAWWNGPTGTQLRKTFRFTESVSTDPATGLPIATITSDSRGAEVFETADVVSTGDEFELVLNPTRQWRIAFNANRAQAVRSNVARNLRSVFEELRPLTEGPAGSLLIGTGATNFADDWRTIYNQLLPYLASENAPANELREWRWNGITNYTFDEGRLKGFSIGGGVRWQDELVYGFPIIEDPEFGIVPDIRHPYYAPTQTNYDAWIGYRRKFARFNWSIQLNIRNIGIGNELIPVSAQPDGSVNAWRIREAQTWTLRNTFTF